MKSAATLSLVQDDHVVIAGGDRLTGEGEALAGEFDVERRRVFPHDEAVETGKMNREVRQVLLPGKALAVFAPLHELDDADPEALAYGAQRLAECGRRLSFPVSRVDLDESLAVFFQDVVFRLGNRFHVRTP